MFRIAKAAKEGGADGVTAINTVSGKVLNHTTKVRSNIINHIYITIY